jgi:DNA-binding transcriptional LysR family regulator
MNYTLHQLQVFVKVAELKSVTKAAEALHLSQPAVSIQLKNLQKQFDIPLIEVIGRQIFITEFGNEIVHSSKKILKEINDINYKTLAFKGQMVGELKISSVSTGKYVMPYFLNDFMNQHPGIDLNMDVSNRLKVLNALEENLIDFALVNKLPTNVDVKKESLMPNTLVWVANSDYEFKQKNNINQLKKTPLIFREYGSATGRAMENYIKKNDFPFGKRLELTSNEAVKQAVIAGLGVSLMPLIGLKNDILNGKLKIVSAKGSPIITDWNLVWLKSKKLSPVATAYLEYIRNEKDNIIKEKFSWFKDYLIKIKK